MIFKKPKDVRYVEMAMYIDEKIKQQDISEEESSLIYEYLYHLIYMLAVKNKYFNKEVYYDEFAITLATDVFHRLFTNPKLDELDEKKQIIETKKAEQEKRKMDAKANFKFGFGHCPFPNFNFCNLFFSFTYHNKNN